MNKILFSTIAIILMVNSATAATKRSNEKQLIAVDTFRNDSCHARQWWAPTTGSDLAETLITQLESRKKFNLVKGAQVSDQILAMDIDLNGRILDDSAIRVGQSISAPKLVMFQVIGFKQTYPLRPKSTFSFGGLSVDEDRSTTSLGVEVRIVNTITGKAEFTRVFRGFSDKDKKERRAFRGRLPGSLKEYDRSAMGKALKASMVKIADFLECVMIDRNECQVKYDRKTQPQ